MCIVYLSWVATYYIIGFLLPLVYIILIFSWHGSHHPCPIVRHIRLFLLWLTRIQRWCVLRVTTRLIGLNSLRIIVLLTILSCLSYLVVVLSWIRVIIMRDWLLISSVTIYFSIYKLILILDGLIIIHACCWRHSLLFLPITIHIILDIRLVLIHITITIFSTISISLTAASRSSWHLFDIALNSLVVWINLKPNISLWWWDWIII